MNALAANLDQVKTPKPSLWAIIKSPQGWLATWFFSGRFPWMPGTMGTLAALPFASAMVEHGGKPVLVAAAIIVSILGIFISNSYMTRFNREDDPSEIVIDEVAGMWIALLPAMNNPLSWAVAFVLFRFFDILKPWPISWADKKLPRGLGVMADDIIAGIFAAAGVILTQHYIVLALQQTHYAIP